jgi:hypothetical protein
MAATATATTPGSATTTPTNTPAVAASAVSPTTAPDQAPSLAAGNPPQTQMQGSFGSDQPLWYQGLVSGSRWAMTGYAVPNLMGKNFTLNAAIAELFGVVGRSCFQIMHMPDVKMSKPPNVGLLYNVHMLVVRGRSILAARSLPPNQQRFDPTHAQPNPTVFGIYPIPFFGDAIRQPQVKEWAALSLALLSEMAQHTDNSLAYQFTTDFGGMVGSYLQQIYFLEAIEFFGYTAAQANAPNFTLSAADFANYNPANWFTPVEMTDERLDLGWQPTSNDLRAIRNIPANELVGCCDFPTMTTVPIGGTPTALNPVSTTPANPTGASFLPVTGAIPPATSTPATTTPATS